MIFVTVGTHEQPFDRLIMAIDNLVENNVIDEPVFVQTGYSDYRPKHCNYSQFCSYEKMQKNIRDARIIITHGGPASFLQPLQIGKVPIVVPRKFEFHEHVNNHQEEFANQVEKRMKNIIVVNDTAKLGDVILNYDKLVQHRSKHVLSNNKQFNDNLEKIIHQLV
ncbi:glycosyltransferase [Lacticaseibacillus paracasei]|uniref:glycosyltransferase n=1 Tax=Lacticaseibacillus paracasei TaxID=1597 RepID=UPI003D06C015